MKSADLLANPLPHSESPPAGADAGADASETDLLASGELRKMIAALEDERQALAALDPDKLEAATQAKEALCSSLAPLNPSALTAETRELAQTAKTLNEVNRRVRNLLAANVAARLDAMGAQRPSYTAIPAIRA